MHLWYIGPDGMEERSTDMLPDLLDRPEGVLWLDIPRWDERAEGVLREVFGFHPQTIRESAHRNQVPMFRAYDGYVFLVLHSPQAGAPGHVHSIELDQFVSDRFVVTVHGPLSEAADPAAARVETDALAERLASGEVSPRSGYDVSHALSSAVAERQRTFVAQLTAGLWDLEYRFQEVVAGGPAARLQEPKRFLDELFRARHGFIVARTQAATTHEVFARMHKVRAFGEGEAHERLDDAADQFNHVRVMADVEKENLQGTIDFYQARTNTELTFAAERLAVIAAITLPVTAVSSILGMNLIVNESTQLVQLVVAVLAMAVMSVGLLTWAKRQGWW